MMDLHDKRIVLTGAAGGIGLILSELLINKGARVCRLVRNLDYDPFLGEKTAQGKPCMTLACDITNRENREDMVRRIHEQWGGVDLLINLAGVLDFTPFQDQNPDLLHRMIEVNIEAPMQLARALLPAMLAQRSGWIVNVGSMFGSIGFPYFSTYSATKFALRGYSQALRRELVGTGVGVTYVSPRAVRTALNPPVVHEMAAIGMMHMDEPEPIAQAIVRSIEKERKEVYLGFPESLFARINALLPGLVDKALAKQTAILSKFAINQKVS
ncbi:MAG: SDR family oxidoreductase [Halothiobacillus sp.]